MKAKILLPVLLFLCILSTAACTGGNNGSTSGSRTEIDNPWWETKNDVEYDEDGNVIFEEVEIDLASVVAGEDLGAFNDIVQKFNNEYRGKINVTVTSINQSTFETTVSSNIAQNSNAPDLIMSHQKGHMSFVDNKLIQPFDEAMDASKIQLNMNDYAEKLTEYTDLGYTGHTFGIPIDAQSQVVYYNKQLLQKYNNGVLPTTRSELLEVCSKAKKGESITPISFSTSLDFFYNYTFTTAVLQNGGRLFNEDFKVDWYSDADNLEAFKNGIASIRELVDLGYAAYGVASSAATTSFVNNKALFYLGMPWNANSLFEAYGSNNGGLSKDSVMSDYIGATSIAGWFALDETQDCSNLIFGDSHFFAMSKTVKSLTKKCAIIEFMRWFTQNGEVGALWAEAGHITASLVIANDDAYTGNAFVSNYINGFYPNIDNFVSVGNTPYYLDTFQNLANIFLSTEKKPSSGDEQAIQSAEDTVNTMIDFLG